MTHIDLTRYRAPAKLPGGGVLAKAIRDGATVKDLALDYDVTPGRVGAAITAAGYSAVTGLPKHSPGDPIASANRHPFDVQPWADRALCTQTDPDQFFPNKGGSTREAKKVCLSCDVRTECLKYALDHDERFGIWGGLSERERRKLKKGEPQPRPTPTVTRVRKPRRILTADERAAIVTAYQAGQSPAEIAPSYGCSAHRIRSLVAAAGVRPRTRNEAAQLRHQKFPRATEVA